MNFDDLISIGLPKKDWHYLVIAGMVIIGGIAIYWVYNYAQNENAANAQAQEESQASEDYLSALYSYAQGLDVTEPASDDGSTDTTSTETTTNAVAAVNSAPAVASLGTISLNIQSAAGNPIGLTPLTIAGLSSPDLQS